ncbi:MAG: hydroxymethylglutaryl-CoA synthase [Anaerolineae bacterium]|nr:hydroxymethylglutaryl-CoA synthase [Anaerolineae bacterium]
MKTVAPVGLVGYGAYVPRYRLAASEVAAVWQGGRDHLPVREKSVPGPDEDAVTMAVEAALNAVSRAQVDPAELGAVYVGSESHPYAVKPSSTMVAEAIGAGPSVLAASFEFACKAGTEALQAALGLVGAGMVPYALAIGSDTAQGRPSDELEYTAGAGAAALIVGPAEGALAVVEGSRSYVTDTPDFFRRAGQKYPRHGGRFTGEPGYFGHVLPAAEALLADLGHGPEDYAAVILHQPNAKFPAKAAADLGFRPEQWEIGLLVGQIGNAYAGSSLIGLTAVLDQAGPGDRILLVSFGSGAGSDAFSLVVTDKVSARQGLAPKTMDYVKRRRPIDYALYARYRGKLAV